MAEEKKHHIFHRHKDEDKPTDTTYGRDGGYGGGYSQPITEAYGGDGGGYSQPPKAYGGDGGYGGGYSQPITEAYGGDGGGYSQPPKAYVGDGDYGGGDSQPTEEEVYSDTTFGRDGGYREGYSQTTGPVGAAYDTGAGGYEKHRKEEKEHKRKEHLGEAGALAAGGFALYEKHEAKKDPEHAHRHKIEEGVAGAVAVGGGGYAFHEKHDKKDSKKEAEAAEGKKHHHLF